MTTMQHIWIVLGVLFVLLNIAAGLIWVERRMLAMWQDRLGPNRAGPFGILIVLADTLKLFFKEDWIPPFADKWVFIAGAGYCGGQCADELCYHSFYAHYCSSRFECGPVIFSCHVIFGCV